MGARGVNYYMMNKKIVVLHLIQTLFSKGGTPRKLLSLVANGDRNKFLHIVLVFCNDPDNLSSETRSAGCIVVEVSRPRNYDIRLLFDIRKMVRKYKVDIINTHFARSDIYGMVAGLLFRTPVIKSVHGIPWNDNKLFIYIDRLLARFRYITACNSGASREAERKRSHAKRINIIHNGVVPRGCRHRKEEIEFVRQKIGIPFAAFLVGHVGGFTNWRRQDLIIDAVSILYEKGVHVYCAITGKGPEEIRLKEHAKYLNIEDRVRFLGYIDDVSEFLASIDVFVNMATEEGFGIAVVEAMLAGVPVVLADAGAHPELIVDNESGILVSEGNAQELANALLRLSSDPSLRGHLGEGGKKRAKEKFTISRFVRDFEELYRKVVNK